MKRNNIFMWAYISFIVICSILRICINFFLWTPIVLAITVSSLLFAFEDLFTSIAKAITDSMNITVDFTTEARKKLKKDFDFFDKLDEKVTLHKNEEPDLIKLQASLESVRTSLSEMEQIIEKLEQDTKDDKCSLKKYRKAANVFTYLGFLLLFCVMVFASFIHIPLIIQEILTVVTFAVILITQQIYYKQLEKINDERTTSKAALEAQEQARNKLAESEKKFDHLIYIIEDITAEEEQ